VFCYHVLFCTLQPSAQTTHTAPCANRRLPPRLEPTGGVLASCLAHFRVCLEVPTFWTPPQQSSLRLNLDLPIEAGLVLLAPQIYFILIRPASLVLLTHRSLIKYSYPPLAFLQRHQSTSTKCISYSSHTSCVPSYLLHYVVPRPNHAAF